MKKGLIYRVILFIGMTIPSSLLLGQQHLNLLIPWEKEVGFAPNVGNLCHGDSIYAFSNIYGLPNESAIFIVDQEMEYEEITFDSVDIVTMDIIDDYALPVMKGRGQVEGFFSSSMHLDEREFRLHDTLFIHEVDEYNFSNSISLSGKVYLGGRHKDELKESTNAILYAIDSNIFFSQFRIFHDELEYSKNCDVGTAKEGDFLISNNTIERIGPGNPLLGSVIRTDVTGNEIWSFESKEPQQRSGFSQDQYICELSNEEIVISYKIDKTGDFEWVVQNELHRYPPKFVWLSSEGDSLREWTFPFHYSEPRYVQGIESAEDAGFYVFGQASIDTLEPNIDGSLYIWVAKVDSNGILQWEHFYKHSIDYGLIGAFYIHDFIIKEDGTIAILAQILGLIGEPFYLWLFELDRNGCHSEYPCDKELIILGDIDTLANDTSSGIIEDNKLGFYPNPCSKLLNLKDEHNSYTWSIQIFDMAGKIYYSDQWPLNLQIDISHWPNGTYIIQFDDVNDGLYHEKLLVLH